MSEDLAVAEISKGKYRLRVTLYVELPSGLSYLRDTIPPSRKIAQPSFDNGSSGARPPRLAFTVEEVAEALHIGRDRVYQVLRTGELESIKIGKLRRIPHQALEAYIDRLMSESSKP